MKNVLLAAKGFDLQSTEISFSKVAENPITTGKTGI